MSACSDDLSGNGGGGVKLPTTNLMMPLLFFPQLEPERHVMDYISSFDIRLSKEVYYAGETVEGSVLLENTENIKIKGIRVLLRGKVHAALKVVKSGERRTVKDDQYVLDEKAVIWGLDKHSEVETIPILPRGVHNLAFQFALPQTALPCSLESRYGTIRYYIKVIIDIPYASSPQGIKYFTIIGPHIDCIDQKFLSPLTGQDRLTTCCWCCRRGALAFRVTLDRTAYVCGENIRVRAQVENRRLCQQLVNVKLIQHVEYFIEKGVLGESKGLQCTVFEHKSPPITANSSGKYDSALEQPICLPIVPPTLVGVCRLVQIYYVLKVSLEDEKGNEALTLDFPLTVATVPYRIPNAAPTPVDYDFCSHHVEGGKYVSPEFRLGQVYDGDDGEQKEEEIILYRPVYAKIAERRAGVVSGGSLRGTPSAAAATTAAAAIAAGNTPKASRGESRASAGRMAGSTQSIVGLSENGSGLGRRRSGAATPTFITEKMHQSHEDIAASKMMEKVTAVIERVALSDEKEEENTTARQPLIHGAEKA